MQSLKTPILFIKNECISRYINSKNCYLQGLILFCFEQCAPPKAGPIFLPALLGQLLWAGRIFMQKNACAFYLHYCPTGRLWQRLVTCYFPAPLWLSTRACNALQRLALETLKLEKLKFYQSLSTSGLFFEKIYIIGIYLKVL